MKKRQIKLHVLRVSGLFLKLSLKTLAVASNWELKKGAPLYEIE